MECKEKVLALKEIVAMAKDKTIKLDPKYQRNEVWSKRMEARVFRSILERFPLPKIYLRKIANGRYEVIDGKQRIVTFLEIFKGAVMPIDHKYKYNSKMPSDVKKRIDAFPISVVIMDANDAETIIAFQDLNSGKPLTVNEKLHADPTKPTYLVCRKLNDEGIVELFRLSTNRFNHWSWLSQCASLVWQDMNKLGYLTMGNKYKFEGMETDSQKKEVANRIKEVFDTMMEAFGKYDDEFGEDLYVTNAQATELFWLYHCMISQKIDTSIIDGKELVVDYLDKRYKRGEESNEFYSAITKDLLLKNSTNHRMKFVEEYIKKSNLIKKPFALSL